MASPSLLSEHLTFLYGDEAARSALQAINGLLERYKSKLSPPTRILSQRDALLITYGDQLCQPDVPPLQTMAEFCTQHLSGVVSGIHILPFFPSSSDDGFSVIDYKRVEPALGTWEHIHQIGNNFRLMIDAVINHISSKSDWFQGFLQDRDPYEDYFITVEPGVDLSQVVRPRALPLLEKFNTPSGEKMVWTTFSADQIDLEYHNPQVLIEILDTLLFYVLQGAEFIRLDAIAYLWKEIGSSCIHLPQTHRLVQLFRAVFDQVAPYVQIITETNVPHQENISYFGDGSNEAQMVYNFALPPLVLHTFRTADSSAISEWASQLELPSAQVTFFNFLASHDGIGVTPARGLIPDADINALLDQVQEHSGFVSYRSNSDGSQSPYEMNINYFDALSNPTGGEPLDTQLDRFIAAHAIMLSLVGVPGIYFHSLFGSRGWLDGVAISGRYRSINRQKLGLAEVVAALNDPVSLRSRVFNRLEHLLRIRASHPAFHPFGVQHILELGSRVFALLRVSPDGLNRVVCLHNISDRPCQIEMNVSGMPYNSPRPLFDMVTGSRVNPADTNPLDIDPYQVVWISDNVSNINRG